MAKVRFIKNLKSKNGYIEFEDDCGTYYLRKPTPNQRKEMMVHLCQQCSGKEFKIKDLAKIFAVSDRTIQLLLKELEKDGFIKRFPVLKNDGRHHGYIIEYVGAPIPITDKSVTISRVYNPNNPLTIRDFHWNDYKFIPYYVEPGELYVKYDSPLGDCNTSSLFDKPQLE